MLLYTGSFFNAGGGGGGGAPTPVIETTSNSSQETTTTSHVLSLPSGITAGDVLLLAFRTADTIATTHTTPTDWDLVGSDIQAQGRLSVFKRVADGLEGGTVTVTTSSSRRSAFVCHRISGAHGDVSGTFANSSLAVDPPSHSPAWGSANNLWVAFGSGNSSDWTFSAAPSGYANLVQAGNASSALATRCHIGSANLGIATGTENPGAFTASGGQNFVSATVAVRPG